MKLISQVPSVPVLLFIAATILILWGAGVYVTGDYVATLDIAASLISAGFIVAAFGGLVRAIERLPARIMEAREASLVDDLDVPAVYTMAPDPIAPEQVRKDPSPRPAPAGPVQMPGPVEEEGPKLVREGVIDGRLYRYYDDGSIHADGPDGSRRYASIDELRAEILKRTERRSEMSLTAAHFPAAAVKPVVDDPFARNESQREEDREDAGLFADRTADRADYSVQYGQEAEPVLPGLHSGDLRGSYADEPAEPDPHVDDNRGSSWAGPFRSLLSRNRRDEDRDPDIHESGRDPRF